MILNTMRIIDFSLGHIEQAAALARSNYEEERKFVRVLPAADNLPDLAEFAENGLGVAAFENGDILGFLCCYQPWDNVFTTSAKGTFSPIHAHGAVYENREMICQRLYQAAAEKWVKSGIASHSIALYAHDTQAINSFFANGFGWRCVDAIRPMNEIACPKCDDFDDSELAKSNIGAITTLRRLLSSHLGKSPCFMHTTPQEFEAWLEKAMKRDSRVFIASQGETIVAFLEVVSSGENFATESPDMLNICGAFLLPEHRGKSVMQNLLNFMIVTLKSEGYARLGVDFESFNPTAYGFWLKYFTAYTKGVARRIDDRILEAGV